MMPGGFFGEEIDASLRTFWTITTCSSTVDVKPVSSVNVCLERWEPFGCTCRMKGPSATVYTAIALDAGRSLVHTAIAVTANCRHLVPRKKRVEKILKI